MNNEFDEQFKDIKDTIDDNIVILKRQLKKSEGLKVIIEKITKKEDHEIKVQLVEIKEGIDEDIKSLTENTNKLFEVYDQLVAKSDLDE